MLENHDPVGAYMSSSPGYGPVVVPNRACSTLWLGLFDPVTGWAGGSFHAVGDEISYPWEVFPPKKLGPPQKHAKGLMGKSVTPMGPPGFTRYEWGEITPLSVDYKAWVK